MGRRPCRQGHHVSVQSLVPQSGLFNAVVVCLVIAAGVSQEEVQRDNEHGVMLFQIVEYLRSALATPTPSRPPAAVDTASDSALARALAEDNEDAATVVLYDAFEHDDDSDRTSSVGGSECPDKVSPRTSLKRLFRSQTGPPCVFSGADSAQTSCREARWWTASLCSRCVTDYRVLCESGGDAAKCMRPWAVCVTTVASWKRHKLVCVRVSVDSTHWPRDVCEGWWCASVARPTSPA